MTTNDTTTGPAAAAPAPAADAATGEREQGAQRAAHFLGRVAGEMEASQKYGGGDTKLALAHIPLWAKDVRVHGGALSDAVDALIADRDRLALEVAALRGAMPDALYWLDTLAVLLSTNWPAHMEENDSVMGPGYAAAMRSNAVKIAEAAAAIRAAAEDGQ